MSVHPTLPCFFLLENACSVCPRGIAFQTGWGGGVCPPRPLPPTHPCLPPNRPIEAHFEIILLNQHPVCEAPLIFPTHRSRGYPPADPIPSPAKHTIEGWRSLSQPRMPSTQVPSPLLSATHPSSGDHINFFLGSFQYSLQTFLPSRMFSRGAGWEGWEVLRGSWPTEVITSRIFQGP